MKELALNSPINMEAETKKLFWLTKGAFDKSGVKIKSTKWNYVVMSTKINVGAPLILGLNNGVDKNKPHPPQDTIPFENFKKLKQKKWLGSFAKVYNLLKDYFPHDDVANFMMSNFYFFRSEKTS